MNNEVVVLVDIRGERTLFHCGVSRTQRKWFYVENRDGLADEIRINNRKRKNNKAVFMLYLFDYNMKPMSK